MLTPISESTISVTTVNSRMETAVRNSGKRVRTRALRGTFTLEEWLEDLEFAQSPGLVAETGDWHSGALEIYSHLRTSILDTITRTPEPMECDGHSLGAMLAAFAAADLAQHGIPTSLVTFGGPRCGNDVWAARFPRLVPDCVSVENFGDVVPHVFVAPLYRQHVPTILTVVGGQKLPADITFAHHLVTYKVGLERLASP